MSVCAVMLYVGTSEEYHGWSMNAKHFVKAIGLDVGFSQWITLPNQRHSIYT